MGKVKQAYMAATMDDMGAGVTHVTVKNVSKTYKIKVCKR